MRVCCVRAELASLCCPRAHYHHHHHLLATLRVRRAPNRCTGDSTSSQKLRHWKRNWEVLLWKDPSLDGVWCIPRRVRTRNRPESPHLCGEEMLPVNGVCRAGLLIVGAVLIKKKNCGTSSAARRRSSIVCAICHVLSVVSITPTVWSCGESKCV